MSEEFFCRTGNHWARGKPAYYYKDRPVCAQCKVKMDRVRKRSPAVKKAQYESARRSYLKGNDFVTRFVKSGEEKMDMRITEPMGPGGNLPLSKKPRQASPDPHHRGPQHFPDDRGGGSNRKFTDEEVLAMRYAWFEYGAPGKGIITKRELADAYGIKWLDNLTQILNGINYSHVLDPYNVTNYIMAQIGRERPVWRYQNGNDEHTQVPTCGVSKNPVETQADGLRVAPQSEAGQEGRIRGQDADDQGEVTPDNRLSPSSHSGDRAGQPGAASEGPEDPPIGGSDRLVDD